MVIGCNKVNHKCNNHLSGFQNGSQRPFCNEMSSVHFVQIITIEIILKQFFTSGLMKT